MQYTTRTDRKATAYVNLNIVHNPLPDDKILASSLKAFADKKLNITPDNECVFYSVENIVGNGENAGYQHFSFSNNVFKRPFPQRCQKLSFHGKGITYQTKSHASLCA